MTVAYFGAPGLPKALRRIRLEYFARALRWLRARPEVRGRRAVVLGVSRGAEAALLAGSLFPGSVGAVAAYVPSSVVVGAFPGPGPAWTLRGRPLPYSREVDMREAGAAAIRVERIAGPVLLVSGGQDSVWASGVATEVLAGRLRRRGHPVTRLDFPEAGHAVGAVLPNVATTGAGGGLVEADARGLRESWPELLRLLRSR
jgi:pimeloyl-ACP methyl ester carboxylesterase